MDDIAMGQSLRHSIHETIETVVQRLFLGAPVVDIIIQSLFLDPEFRSSNLSIMVNQSAGLLQNMYIHSSPLNFALHLPESFLELVELERSRFELILQIRVIML